MNRLHHLIATTTLGAAALAAAWPAAASEFAEGEVRRLDAEGARITLKHGEIKNLDMPPMTMVFHVKDKAWLAQVKPGDKVRFKAVAEGGRYTVTELQSIR